MENPINLACEKVFKSKLKSNLLPLYRVIEKRVPDLKNKLHEKLAINRYEIKVKL